MTGLTALQAAAGLGRSDLVRSLLAAGADVNAVDPHGGASALHKACQVGSLDVVEALVEAGAFVNLQSVGTGHTPLLDAIWFKWPDIVAYLLDAGALLEIRTHYGFSLDDHLAYALKVNVTGRDRLERIRDLIAARRAADARAVESQQLMAAARAGDLAAVQEALAAGAAVDARYPVLGGFDDAHTPLLVAAREGHAGVVQALLAAGADVNAVEPTFGAVPLHKATYNGHADITALLAHAPGVDLDFQGASNGYTPLHDALWHGYEDCARILLRSGARLDLLGHDGKSPLDIAREALGAHAAIVAEIIAEIERRPV
jgi:ankyrin repeat protein